jgi:enoyl-CoA hydratase/carnithine racemase
LNADLCRALIAAFAKADENPSIGAILLTANGKTFCAGMDIAEISEGTNDVIARLNEELFTVGPRMNKPLIAAVDGAAMGGGVGLIANCHIVLASEQATFGLTEIRLGLWPFLIYRAVAAAIGERRTTELALTGRVLPAREALEIGLVHQVVADLPNASIELATTVANHSPTAVGEGLGFIRETRGLDWKVAGDLGRRVRNQVFASADFQEGISAFFEKRAPKWPSIS